MTGAREKPQLHLALAVGPDQQVGEVLKSVFRPPGWDVVSVATDLDALAAVESGHFDIIVTSTATFDRNDIELLRRLRRAHAHTRVIVVTSRSTPADVISAMREGAFSYFNAPYSPGELANALREAMEAPSWDDGIELVSATPEWIRLQARCDMQTANRLLQFLGEIAAELPDDERQAVAIASREMLLNAIEHGGRFNPEDYVEMSYIRTRRAVSCRIRDPGQGFSPEDIPHAAMSNPPDEPLRHIEQREASGLRPGGYGVMLARKLVDELIYNEQGNEVILIKYVEPGHGNARSTG
jgi:CheY-like chemotaxis protein/anti-sigma regulatory factor (Ser/Thr protein kinase)